MLVFTYFDLTVQDGSREICPLIYNHIDDFYWLLFLGHTGYNVFSNAMDLMWNSFDRMYSSIDSLSQLSDLVLCLYEAGQLCNFNSLIAVLNDSSMKGLCGSLPRIVDDKYATLEIGWRRSSMCSGMSRLPSVMHITGKTKIKYIYESLADIENQTFFLLYYISSTINL